MNTLKTMTRPATALLLVAGCLAAAATPALSQARRFGTSYRIAQSRRTPDLFSNPQPRPRNNNSVPIFVQPARQNVIPAGTLISVRYEEAERIVVAPDETIDVTLLVDEDVRSPRGTVLIPRNSEIRGKIEPVEEGEIGSRFVADDVSLRNSNRRYTLDADSNTVTTTEEIDEGTNVGSIIKGAAIGAGAAAIISLITGDRRISFLEILGGAVLGAGAGWIIDGREEATVVVIEPERDLDLTVNSDLVL